VQKVNMCCKK